MNLQKPLPERRAVAALVIALLGTGLLGCADSGTEQHPGEGNTGPHSEVPAKGTSCGGLTPLEAARYYEGEASEAGASKRFIELVTEPTAAVEASPGYPRLVGAFYASTLPPAKRAAAAAACTKELAAE